MTTTDQLASKLLEIINQIQAGVVAHAPDAVNLALQTIQISAVGRLLLVIPALAILIFLWRIGITLKRRAQEEFGRISKEGDYEIFTVVGSIAVLVIISLVVCLIFNIWNYVAIVNPKLYLAHEIIEKVMQ